MVFFMHFHIPQIGIIITYESCLAKKISIVIES